MRQGDPMSPLIYVLAMDYLVRSLKVAYAEEGFKFHLGCTQMRLGSLSFADDLLFFYRANKRVYKA